MHQVISKIYRDKCGFKGNFQAGVVSRNDDWLAKKRPDWQGVVLLLRHGTQWDNCATMLNHRAGGKVTACSSGIWIGTLQAQRQIPCAE